MKQEITTSLGRQWYLTKRDQLATRQLSKVGRKLLFMQSARNADFKAAVAGTDRLETVLENKAIN
jgi:hypothetical protein